MPKKISAAEGGVPAHLAAAIDSAVKAPPPPDRLEALRDKVRGLRDLYAEKRDLAERAAAVQAQITDMETRELVDFFNELKVPSLSLDPEGNHPGFNAEKQPFYSAKIPDERKGEANDWLIAEGHGDLIKYLFTVPFGMGQGKTAEKFKKWLTAQNIDYSSSIGVHAGTLLAFVKKQLKSGAVIPMDLLGAHTGEIVKIKERKEG